MGRTAMTIKMSRKHGIIGIIFLLLLLVLLGLTAHYAVIFFGKSDADSDGSQATSNVKEVSSYTTRPKATVPAAVLKDVETTPQSLLITGDNRVKVEVKTRTAFIVCAVFLTAVLMMIGILS